MTAFDDRVAPLLARIADAERNEAMLAARVESAVARGGDVEKSAGSMASQFPDVEVRDPLDGQWVLEPMWPSLRERWSGRRRAIVATECPRLAQAAQSATAAAAGIERQRSALAQRRVAARRNPNPHSAGARPSPGWRRLLGGFTQPQSQRQLPVTPSRDFDGALRRAAQLAQTGDRVERQQNEFQVLASELQRAERYLDDSDAGLKT